MSEKLDKNEWPGSEGASMLIPKDQTAFLMTTATLNYVPVNSEKLYQVNINMHTAPHLCTSLQPCPYSSYCKNLNHLGCDSRANCKIC